MRTTLIGPALRSITQAILLLAIHKAFMANSRLLSSCQNCGNVSAWFDWVADSLFVLALASLIPVMLLALVALQMQLQQDDANDPSTRASGALAANFHLLSDVTSLGFFVGLAIGIVLTDGILESALIGLMTVSLLYTMSRIGPHPNQDKWRVWEMLVALLIVILGEFALGLGFGAKAEFRSAALIFDSSLPTKLLGYGSFCVAFSIILAENYSDLKSAFHGFISR